MSIKFKLEIECENDVFAGDDLFYEVSRILKEVADRVQRGYNNFSLMDVNGNSVGKARFVIK